MAAVDIAAHARVAVKSRHVWRSVHGTGWTGRLNAAIADRITRAVGTMWTAYLFALLAFISLPAAIFSHDPIIIVAWIAQTFLQLVLLPVIIVGQNVQAAHSDARSEQDHQMLSQLVTLAGAIAQKLEAP